MEHTPTTTAPNVIDLILDTVFVVDVNGMIVSASGGCEAMLGYTPAELKGRRMLDMVAPEDVERTQAAAKSVIAGSQFLHFENRYVRKDGALVDLMWSAKWSEAEQARVGVARDVTERKREERLSKAIHEIAEATLANDTLDGLTQHLCSVLRSLIPAARCIFVQAGLHGSEDEQQAQGRAFVSQMQALGSARAQAMSVGV
jgi:PAS domain S-box-containing protein